MCRKSEYCCRDRCGAYRSHCSCDCEEKSCKKTVDALCVTEKLQVRGCASLDGTTQVEKLCFKDQGVPRDCKCWCVQEDSKNMLSFQYRGGKSPQLRIAPDGSLLPSGGVGGVENISATGGDTNVAPDLQNTVTFVHVQGSSTDLITGTMPDGLYDGQKKVVGLTNAQVNAQYRLTLPKVVGQPTPLVVTLGRLNSAINFNAACLIWSATAQKWMIVNNF